MNIVRYRQWPAQRVLRGEIRQVFDRFIDGTTDSDESVAAASQWTPLVDIREEAGRFVIQADLPGIDPTEIEVHMDKGILSIKGERRGGGEAETGRYSRIERRHGGFHRRFALPDSADADGIAASGRNGVLEISIPKRPDTTPRRIQVGSIPVETDTVQ